MSNIYESIISNNCTQCARVYMHVHLYLGGRSGCGGVHITTLTMADCPGRAALAHRREEKAQATSTRRKQVTRQQVTR